MKSFEEIIEQCNRTADARTQAYVTLKKEAPYMIGRVCEAAKKLQKAFPLFCFQIGITQNTYESYEHRTDLFEFQLTVNGEIKHVIEEYETGFGLKNKYDDPISIYTYNFSGRGLLKLLKMMPKILEDMQVKSLEEIQEIETIIKS